MYATLKFRVPISLFSLLKLSDQRETRLKKSCKASTNFPYPSISMWNEYHKIKSINDFSSKSMSIFKSDLKKYLLEVQTMYDDEQWSDNNFDFLNYPTPTSSVNH